MSREGLAEDVDRWKDRGSELAMHVETIAMRWEDRRDSEGRHVAKTLRDLLRDAPWDRRVHDPYFAEMLEELRGRS